MRNKYQVGKGITDSKWHLYHRPDAEKFPDYFIRVCDWLCPMSLVVIALEPDKMPDCKRCLKIVKDKEVEK